MAPIVTSDGSWQVLNPNGSWGLPDYGITESIANWVRPGSTDVKQAVSQNMQGTPYASTTPDPYKNAYSLPDKSTGGNRNGDVLGQATSTQQRPDNGQQGGGVDWSVGLTGEQVRALGLNPDTMSSTGGKYYSPNGAGGSGGGQPSIDWDAMYAPSFNALGDLANFLSGNRETSRNNLISQYDTTKGQIGEEQGTLEAGLAEQQRQLGESGRSAAAEALRSYNALMQQNLSRYGLSTGAGQFLSDLVGQEYLRSRSGINQQMQSGQNQLALEGQKTKQYISKKIGDLDMWKNEAFQKIDEDFQSKMYDINAQKGVLERDKQQQKMAVLQDTLNYQRQVEQQDRQFRMDLANFAVQNLQNVTGQTYTPQEIAGVVNDMMGREISGITQSTGNQVAYTPFGARNYTDEQLKRLNPLQS